MELTEYKHNLKHYTLQTKHQISHIHHNCMVLFSVKGVLLGCKMGYTGGLFGWFRGDTEALASGVVGHGFYRGDTGILQNPCFLHFHINSAGQLDIWTPLARASI